MSKPVQRTVRLPYELDRKLARYKANRGASSYEEAIRLALEETVGSLEPKPLFELAGFMEGLARFVDEDGRICSWSIDHLREFVEKPRSAPISAELAQEAIDKWPGADQEQQG